MNTNEETVLLKSKKIFEYPDRSRIIVQVTISSIVVLSENNLKNRIVFEQLDFTVKEAMVFGYLLFLIDTKANLHVYKFVDCKNDQNLNKDGMEEENLPQTSSNDESSIKIRLQKEYDLSIIGICNLTTISQTKFQLYRDKQRMLMLTDLLGRLFIYHFDSENFMFILKFTSYISQGSYQLTHTEIEDDLITTITNAQLNLMTRTPSLHMMRKSSEVVNDKGIKKTNLLQPDANRAITDPGFDLSYPLKTVFCGFANNIKVVKMNDCHLLYVMLNLNDFMVYKMYVTANGIYDPMVNFYDVENFCMSFQRIAIKQIVIDTINTFKAESQFLNILQNWKKNDNRTNILDEQKEGDLNELLSEVLFNGENYDIGKFFL